MMAAREGHEDLARKLLAAGADPRLVNDRGESALTWAMRNKNFHLAQIVASPAEFAKAAKAPPASFGKPIRSRPAPLEISEILRQMRQAEAEGRPVEPLRQAFFDMVENFKKESRKLNLESRTATPAGPPRALVITAKRQPDGGERAELLYGDEAGDVATILAHIRQAQSEGKPITELRKQLFEAVGRFKEKGSDPAGANGAQ
jgi:hypothetical protein